MKLSFQWFVYIWNVVKMWKLAYYILVWTLNIFIFQSWAGYGIKSQQLKSITDKPRIHS
jgi:hypothetical protein